MTTLYGLVTIYELFAGFNLINTCVVNCLIMCPNARKMHRSEAKKSKNFPGSGLSSDPSHIGEGVLPPQVSPPQTPLSSAPAAPGYSRLRRSTWLPNENPGSASEDYRATILVFRIENHAHSLLIIT